MAMTYQERIESLQTNRRGFVEARDNAEVNIHRIDGAIAQLQLLQMEEQAEPVQHRAARRRARRNHGKGRRG